MEQYTDIILLHKITKAFRIAIILREFRGLSYEEIAQTTNASIGTISEIYDSRFPFEARGAFAQAWSVAEVLRIVINK